MALSAPFYTELRGASDLLPIFRAEVYMGVAEYAPSAQPSSPTTEYIYAGANLVASITGGTPTYYHPDQLSNRALTNSTGSVVGQQGHYPFGESWYSSGTATKWKFTSYERDPESANDYAMARYDVNRLGRFSSPDPIAGSIANPQTLNRYAYVHNDPVNLVDPLGLETCYTVTYGYTILLDNNTIESVTNTTVQCYEGGGDSDDGGGATVVATISVTMALEVRALVGMAGASRRILSGLGTARLASMAF